jgi:hypothetical protein
MLYDEYIAYCQQNEKIYGEKPVVVMEVGSFFECYAVETDTRSNERDKSFKKSREL